MGEFVINYNTDGSIDNIWHTGYDKYYTLDDLVDLLNNMQELINIKDQQIESLREYMTLDKDSFELMVNMDYQDDLKRCEESKEKLLKSLGVNKKECTNKKKFPCIKEDEVTIGYNKNVISDLCKYCRFYSKVTLNGKLINEDCEVYIKPVHDIECKSFEKNFITKVKDFLGVL